ncbi:MAG: hypothetical protein M0020_01985 [Actinomycetota bacterium]|nr:hypothetical protein [Actinomycetota bacterium]
MSRSSGSLGRRVARAAATGGSRTYRGQRPTGWYMAMAVITALGLALVVYSKSELATATTTTTAPAKHAWFVALSVDICGTVQPPLAQNANYGAVPVHTQGGGVIRVEISAQSKSGPTLGSFVLHYPGMVLRSNELQMPNGKLWTNGDRCGNKAGSVQAMTWHDPVALNGTKVSGDPSSIQLHNLQLITIGFVPSGTHLARPAKSVITAMQNANLQAEAPTTTAAPSSAPPSSLPTTPSSVTPSSSTVPVTIPSSSGAPAKGTSGSAGSTG